MYSFAPRFFWMVVLGGSLFCAASASAVTTYLSMNSQPGDYIGGGATYKFTPVDGTFSVTNSSSAVNISFHMADYSQSWFLDFGSPESTKFGGGQYEGAQRTAFRSPTRPGIDVSGDGRGCNRDTGQFLVSDFALAPDGTVARLAIDFEQHCEGSNPALYGSFRYNSSVSAVPRLGVGNTYTLKGNNGISDVLIAIALSVPSPKVVAVQYATADATGPASTMCPVLEPLPSRPEQLHELSSSRSLETDCREVTRPSGFS